MPKSIPHCNILRKRKTCEVLYYLSACMVVSSTQHHSWLSMVHNVPECNSLRRGETGQMAQWLRYVLISLLFTLHRKTTGYWQRRATNFLPRRTRSGVRVGVWASFLPCAVVLGSTTRQDGGVASGKLVGSIREVSTHFHETHFCICRLVVMARHQPLIDLVPCQ